METKYYIEFCLESKPLLWKRCSAYSFNTFTEAEADIQKCLKRQYENAEINYSTFKDRVLEYRVIEVSTLVKETPLSNFSVKSHIKLVETKQDELHYLNQIFKYLKHLELLYITKLSDREKLQRIQISINNTSSEIKIATKTLEELTGNKFEIKNPDP